MAATSDDVKGLKRSSAYADDELTEEAIRSLDEIAGAADASSYAMKQALYRVTMDYVEINKRLSGTIDMLDRTNLFDDSDVIALVYAVIHKTEPISHPGLSEESSSLRSNLDAANNELNDLREENISKLRDAVRKRVRVESTE
jgi:hypothetical protein